jgi:hypothetical protein
VSALLVVGSLVLGVVVVGVEAFLSSFLSSFSTTWCLSSFLSASLSASVVDLSWETALGSTLCSLAFKA